MAKEDWRLCAEWLMRCQILAPDHRIFVGDTEVFDLAQLLRDGVMLCHLANHLHFGAVDPKEFCLRPQMSQVCLY
jgi:guanine nucleotide exchange factor VAV